MPFDGIETIDTHPLAKLGAVERLLATEQQWCKGRLRDAHGRHCLVGAIEAVDGRQMLQRVILQAAREVSGKRYWRIEFFNDDPRTTHADVLAVLTHARQDIISGMVCESQPWHRRWLRMVRSLSSPAADIGSTAHLGKIDQPSFPSEFSTGYYGFDDHPSAAPERTAPRAVVMELQD
jgi:hypothetical protein